MRGRLSWLPLIVVVFSHAAGAGVEDLDLQDVTRAIRAREAATRYYSVKAVFQNTMGSDYTGEELDFSEAYEFVVDRSTGRFRVHRIGEVYNAAGGELHGGQEFFVQNEEISAFDGQRTVQLAHPAGEDGRVFKAVSLGRIIPERRVGWTTNPDEFLVTDGNQPVSHYLESSDCQILGSEVLDDRSVLIVECDHGVRDDDPLKWRWKSRFWIDPSRNFVVPRSEGLISRDDGDNWIVWSKASREGWSEIEPGFWVPSTFREEALRLVGDESPRLFYRHHVQLTDWTVHQEPAADVFRVAFPEGTTVTDDRTARVYTSGEVDASAIERAALASESLRADFLEAKDASVAMRDRPPPLWTKLTIGALGLGVAIAAIVWGYRIRAGGVGSKSG